MAPGDKKNLRVTDLNLVGSTNITDTAAPTNEFIYLHDESKIMS
jgi:hypothetical protein